MTPRTRPAPALLVLLGLLACKGGSDDTAPVASATPPATDPAPSAAASSAEPEVEASELESIAKQIVPRGIPTERSKPPTVAEWNAASEISVRHSGPLGCETKRVREWLRVSCRTTGSSPPQIQAVTLVQPKKNAEFFTYDAKGVSSVVLPLREGLDAKIAFDWTERGRRTLTATWPKGAPAPGITFDAGAGAGGAAAPSQGGKPKCSDVCKSDRGFPSACEASPCPKGYRCLDNHICVCTIPCQD